jgi:hypothetical protein
VLYEVLPAFKDYYEKTMVTESCQWFESRKRSLKVLPWVTCSSSFNASLPTDLIANVERVDAARHGLVHQLADQRA